MVSKLKIVIYYFIDKKLIIIIVKERIFFNLILKISKNN
jgi:hypothetical protein